MSQLRIAAVLLSIIATFAVFIHLLMTTMVPTEADSLVAAYDMGRPRAPSEARKIQNPVPETADVLSIGKKLFQGKGNCWVCHGMEGKGDGEAGVMLTPPPRDLTDGRFQMLRKDGEIFWSIKFGVPDTGMLGYVPRHVSEEEAWMIVRYIRSLPIHDRS